LPYLISTRFKQFSYHKLATLFKPTDRAFFSVLSLVAQLVGDVFPREAYLTDVKVTCAEAELKLRKLGMDRQNSPKADSQI
jgi:hypothetical protein